MIDALNAIAQVWWSWMSAMFWQVGLLILLIALVDRLVRRWAWPQLRYALWSLVLIKLILPPTLSLPSGIVPRLQSAAREAVPWMRPDEPSPAQTSARVSHAASTSPTSAIAPQHIVASPWLETDLSLTVLSVEAMASPIPQKDADVAIESTCSTPQPMAKTRLSWKVGAMAIWLAGVLTLGTWLLVRLHALAGRYAGEAATSLPQSFYNQVAGCAKRLGLHPIPRVRVVNELATPAVFGVLRPTLLVPEDYVRTLSHVDTEHMLLHELAHLKRGDLRVHALYMLLQIVYWFNPLLWLVRRPLHRLRELSCDATVANLLQEQTTAYRQTLLRIAQRFLARSTEPGLGLLGLLEDANPLVVRLNWLERPMWRYRTMRHVLVIAAMLTMLACVLPMAQGDDQAIVAVNNEEPDRAAESAQLSQELEALQAALAKLETDRLKLQQQVETLAQAQQAAVQAKAQTVRARVEAKEVEEAAAKAAMQATKARAETLEALIQARQTPRHQNAQNPPAAGDAERLITALTAVRRTDRNAGTQWQQWAQAMKDWGKAVDQWKHGEALAQWKNDVRQWAKAQADREGLDATTPTRPMPEMPPVPEMPPMPEMPPLLKGPAETVQVSVSGPATSTPQPAEVLPSVVAISRAKGTSGSVAGVAVAVPPEATAETPSSGRNIPVQNPEPNVSMPVATAVSRPMPKEPTQLDAAANDSPITTEERISLKQSPPLGKRWALEHIATRKLSFTLKPTSETVVLENIAGNIILTHNPGDSYEVTATMRATGNSAAQAQEIVNQVRMHSRTEQDRFYITAERNDGADWDNLTVDFHVTVPTGARMEVKTELGKIQLNGLKGRITARTNMGAIRVVNSSGQLALSSNMGDIEFVAPDDLSAKLLAETNMGSIESDLPLRVVQENMFGRTSEGTIGAGQDKIQLKTNMGTIRLKQPPSSTGEATVESPVGF